MNTLNYPRSFHFLVVFCCVFLTLFLGNCTVDEPDVEEKPLQKLWVTFLGDEGPDYCYSLRLDGQGDIYVAGTGEGDWWNGSTSQTPARSMEQPGGGFITRMDINGNLLNTIPLDSMVCYDFAFDGEDNFCMIGSGGDTLTNPIRRPGYSDILIAKMTRDGDLLWHTYMGSEKYQDVEHDVAVDRDGNIFVAGRSELGWGEPVHAFNGFYDGLVAKFDGAGRRQWHTFLGSTEHDSANAVAVAPDGSFLVAGESGAEWGGPMVAHSGGGDGFVAKMDGNGNVIWNTFIDFGNREICKDIVLHEDGDIFTAGISEVWFIEDGMQKIKSDVFIARFSPEGDLRWKYKYGTDEDDQCTGIAIDENNNIYMMGSSEEDWEQAINAKPGGSDAFLAKFDAQGILDWIYFMGSEELEIPGKFALHPSGAAVLAGYSLGEWGSPIRGYSAYGDIFVTSLSLSENSHASPPVF